MKAISASIIVLAAAVMISVGSHVQHNDTKAFVQFVGCVVGLIGLTSWYAAMKHE